MDTVGRLFVPGELTRTSASALAIQADMLGSLGDLSNAEACAFMALDLFDGPHRGDIDRVGFLAFAATSIALDSGNQRLVMRAMNLPIHSARSPRQRVHAQAAVASAAFMSGDWPEARDWLETALQTCRLPEARHLVGLPIALWIDMAMAIEDDEALEHGLAQIDALPSSLAERVASLPRIRARAWRAASAGHAEQSLALLEGLSGAPHASRLYATSRLDAAWLACDLGRDDQARRLIAAAGRWAHGSPLGRVVLAYRAARSGDDTASAAAQALRRSLEGRPTGRTLASARLRRQFFRAAEDDSANGDSAAGVPASVSA